jgi:hypothetical protein
MSINQQYLHTLLPLSIGALTQALCLSLQ